jgi:NADPH2:quinone reductase
MTLPAIMPAITYPAPGAGFEDMTLPAPAMPEGHDMVIAVRAIAINPLDLKQHAGPPRVLGVDAAGEVVAMGPAVHDFALGDHVCCAAPPNRPGSYAGFVTVDARLVGRVPPGMGFAAAAALPCAGLTAWEALFERLRIDDSSSLLVLGGAGGVGSMAVQLARLQTQAVVTATASRPESQAWLRRLGAHHLLDHAAPLPPQAREQNLRFSHILATQSTEAQWEALCAMLAPRGTICAIDMPGMLDMTKLRPKGGGFVFEALFAKALARAPDMASQGQALSAIAAHPGLLPVISLHGGRICAANIAACHAALASGRMLGKAVLEGW